MEVLFDLIWLFSFSSFFFFLNYKVTCVELDKKMHTEKENWGDGKALGIQCMGKVKVQYPLVSVNGDLFLVLCTNYRDTYSVNIYRFSFLPVSQGFYLPFSLLVKKRIFHHVG